MKTQCKLSKKRKAVRFLQSKVETKDENEEQEEIFQTCIHNS